MLTTNADLETFANLAALSHGDTHQRSDTILINTHEGIVGQETLHHVIGQELARVIT